MAALVALATGGLGAVIGFLAMYLPQALFPLAVACTFRYSRHEGCSVVVVV